MVNKIRNGIVWVRTPKCATSTMAVHLQNFCEWKDMNYTQSSHHGTMAPKNCINLGHLWSDEVNWDVVKQENDLIDNLKNHKFDIVYLLGQDNLDFNKKDEFIIYQGSHGDKGAEVADIILPGSAYTEQDGYFTNLEGKIQKSNKASYPPGDAKEDWQIINELAEFMNNRKLFNDKDELESSMFNYLNLQKEKQSNESELTNISEKQNFKNENLKIFFKDYYFSNVVARSSKTMIECNNAKIKLKTTGTEG